MGTGSSCIIMYRNNRQGDEIISRNGQDNNQSTQRHVDRLGPNDAAPMCLTSKTFEHSAKVKVIKQINRFIGYVNVKICKPAY